MDVAVYGRGIDFKEKHGGWMEPLGKDAVASLAQRQGENRATDDPAVDEGHLKGPVASPLAWFSNPSADTHPIALKGWNRQQLLEKGFAMQVAETDGQIISGGKAENLPVIAPAEEGNLRVRHGEDLDLLQEIGSLGLLSAKELAACGNIEKEVGHFDGGSRGVSAVLHLVDLAARHLDQGSDRILPATGGETESGDAGDARDRLTAESQGGDGGEISAFPDLAGGMTLKAEKGVGTIHSGAVVSDPDQAGAPTLELNGDPLGPGVDGVLDEFLDYRGGSLDHFPGSHLAGKDVWKKADGSHEERVKAED
jgi:hypothetical protein